MTTERYHVLLRINRSTARLFDSIILAQATIIFLSFSMEVCRYYNLTHLYMGWHTAIREMLGIRWYYYMAKDINKFIMDMAILYCQPRLFGGLRSFGSWFPDRISFESLS